MERSFIVTVFVILFGLQTKAQPSADTSLNLVSPNGNEFWQVGKTPNIIWESNNIFDDVYIEYSTNNGISWNPIATVSSATEHFPWTIPNAVSKICLVRLRFGEQTDVSDGAFEISNDSSTCAIVVIGSSTAEGLGASSVENSWVYKYKEALFQKNTKFKVLNFGMGGLTTYNLLPTNSSAFLPAGVAIDVNRNITKALLYNPVAIILNLPSNDTYKGYSKETQLANFAEINAEAEYSAVPVWITTTQPRYFANAEDVQKQRDVRDEILNVYEGRTIDFWTDLSDVNGRVLSSLDSGDGTHVNDAGHDILLNKVLEKNIENLSFRGNMANGVDRISIKRYSKIVGDKCKINFYSFNEGLLKVKLYNEFGQEVVANEEFYSFKTGSNKFKLRLKHTKYKELYCMLDFQSNGEPVVETKQTFFVK